MALWYALRQLGNELVALEGIVVADSQLDLVLGDGQRDPSRTYSKCGSALTVYFLSGSSARTLLRTRVQSVVTSGMFAAQLADTGVNRCEKLRGVKM